MNKKEVTEIKKLFTKERCCLNRLCGCYVDADKNKVVQFKEAFLSLPEEEIYKYLDIFRKSLSGTLGKNLLNMEFPLEQEMGDGTQKSLLALRDSELKDDVMLDAFYDRMIETYYHPENYLILLVHGSYDIPMKTSDLGGVDSLYSIVQMPSGVPVASVAINGGQNAGILAAQILASSDAGLLQKLKDYRTTMKESVVKKADKLDQVGYKNYE